MASCEKNRGGKSPFACDGTVFFPFPTFGVCYGSQWTMEPRQKEKWKKTLGMEEALEELSEMCKHQNEQNESAELGNRLGYCAGPCACA